MNSQTDDIFKTLHQIFKKVDEETVVIQKIQDKIKNETCPFVNVSDFNEVVTSFNNIFDDFKKIVDLKEEVDINDFEENDEFEFFNKLEDLSFRVEKFNKKFTNVINGDVADKLETSTPSIDLSFDDEELNFKDLPDITPNDIDSTNLTEEDYYSLNNSTRDEFYTPDLKEPTPDLNTPDLKELNRTSTPFSDLNKSTNSSKIGIKRNRNGSEKTQLDKNSKDVFSELQKIFKQVRPF